MPVDNVSGQSSKILPNMSKRSNQTLAVVTPDGQKSEENITHDTHVKYCAHFSVQGWGEGLVHIQELKHAHLTSHIQHFTQYSSTWNLKNLPFYAEQY